MYQAIRSVFHRFKCRMLRFACDFDVCLWMWVALMWLVVVVVIAAAAVATFILYCIYIFLFSESIKLLPFFHGAIAFILSQPIAHLFLHISPLWAMMTNKKYDMKTLTDWLTRCLFTEIAIIWWLTQMISNKFRLFVFIVVIHSVFHWSRDFLQFPFYFVFHYYFRFGVMILNGLYNENWQLANISNWVMFWYENGFSSGKSLIAIKWLC